LLQEVVEKLIAAELCHQKWGPKKVIAWLRERYPEEQWPPVSTVGEILRREGLVGLLAYLCSIGNTIVGGTSEINQTLIAIRGLGLPR
jgi:hypothetical protein